MTIDEKAWQRKRPAFYITALRSGDISKSVEMEWAKEMRNGERG